MPVSTTPTTQRWQFTTATTPPSTTIATTQRPITSTRQFNTGQQDNLRASLHNRLQRLRLSQMETRRRFEERLRQQQQFQVQPGQTFLQFGPPQSNTPSTTIRPNGSFLLKFDRAVDHNLL